MTPIPAISFYQRLAVALMLFVCGSFHGVLASNTPIALKVYAEPLLELQKQVKGEPTGFAVEVVKHIISHSSLQGEVQLLPWARAYERALVQPNTLLFSTRRTAQREALFIWARPVFAEGFAPWYSDTRLILLCNANFPHKIDNLAQARKFLLAIPRDDYLEEYARNTLKWPSSRLILTKGFSDIFQMLNKERVDLALTGENELDTLLRRERLNPIVFKVCFRFNFQESPLYFAFHPDTPREAIEAFNAAYDNMIKSGIYHHLYHSWNPL